MQGYSTGLLKRIPNTKGPTSFVQPAFLANVHKGKPPGDVRPQDHGPGTCEIEYLLCRGEKEKSSGYSGRSPFQQRNESHGQADSSWKRVKVKSGVFPPKANKLRSRSDQEYGTMEHQLQLVEL